MFEGRDVREGRVVAVVGDVGGGERVGEEDGEVGFAVERLGDGVGEGVTVMLEFVSEE